MPSERSRARITVAAAVPVDVGHEDLAAGRISAAVSDVCGALGLQAFVETAVHPIDSVSEPEFCINGRLCSRTPPLSKVVTDFLQESDPDAPVDNAGQLALLCAESLEMQPAILLNDEVVDLWLQQSRVPLGADAATVLLQSLLQARIRINSTDAVRTLFRDDKPIEELVEDCLARLSSDAVQITVAPQYLDELLAESSDLALSTSEFVGATLYEDTGVSSPPLVIAPDAALRGRTFCIVVNDRPVARRKGLSAEEVYVDASVRLDAALSPDAREFPAPSGYRMGAVTQRADYVERHAAWQPVGAIDYLQNAVLHAVDRNAALFVHQRSLEPLWRLLGSSEVAPQLLEAVQRAMPLWRITSYLRELVLDKISIRYLIPVLERALDFGVYASEPNRYAALADPLACGRSSDQEILGFLRSGLGPQAADRASHGSGIIVAYLLDSSLQSALADASQSESIDVARRVIAAVDMEMSLSNAVAVIPHIVTTAVAAPALRSILRHRYPDAVVLSLTDLPAGLLVQPMGRLGASWSAAV